MPLLGVSPTLNGSKQSAISFLATSNKALKISKIMRQNLHKRVKISVFRVLKPKYLKLLIKIKKDICFLNKKQ